VIKHQHLPYGFTIGVEDGGGFRDEGGGFEGAFFGDVIEVEDFLNGS
jgi:hypothetical protein